MSVLPNEVVRADVFMTFDGTDRMMNNFQFMKTSVGTATDSDVLDDILEVMETLYAIIDQVITILVAFDKIRVTNVTTGAVIGEIDFATILAGTQAGDSLAPGLCPVANFGTAVPKVVLRKFFPPPSEASNDTDGRFGSGGLADYALLLAALLLPRVATNDTWQYGYLSPKAAAFVTPTSASMQNVFGYQRRRKQGRGA